MPSWAGYWNSPKVVFQSGGQRYDGWEAMRDRYRRRYQAEGKAMGRLAFSSLEIEPLGPESMLVRGGWRLTMPDGTKPGGLFTLIVRKFPEGWKIVHDHTSAEEPAVEQRRPRSLLADRLRCCFAGPVDLASGPFSGARSRRSVRGFRLLRRGGPNDGRQHETGEKPADDLVEGRFRFRKRLAHVMTGEEVKPRLADRVFHRGDDFFLAGNLANADRCRWAAPCLAIGAREEHHDAGEQAGR